MTNEDVALMSGAAGNTPWICHVCGKSSRGESSVCEICFRTTCQKHLRRSSIYNKESGLYEFTAVCIECTLAKFV